MYISLFLFVLPFRERPHIGEAQQINAPLDGYMWSLSNLDLYLNT